MMLGTAAPPDGLSLNPDARRFWIRRWRLFAGVFLVYLVYAVVDLFDQHGVVAIVAGLVLMAGFVALYLGALPLGMFQPESVEAHWVPPAMTVLTVAYLLVAGRGGLVFIVYLCIAYVLLLQPRVAAPLVLAASGAAVFLPQYVHQWGFHGLQWAVGGPSLLTALVMWGVRLNAISQIELYQARGEIARLATDQERLRIARDLHDLLGHSLTTVAVKSELAARLAVIDPPRAAAEMREVAALARQGLHDVRATVAGYRDITLITELAAAREVLRAAGIQAELPAAVDSVAGDLRELFGWVLREGVTNAVRHSHASRVRVELSARAIEIVDDGSGGAAGPFGSGLAGLTERAVAVGGNLTAGTRDEGGWRLSVEVPA